MAFICSKVFILFIWACISTLSSANEGWFWGHNCTLPFISRHNRPPPPPLRRPRTPPSHRFPPAPSRHPRTPPSPRFPPPSRHPRTPPSPRLSPPPPSRRPRTPPPQWIPSPPPPSPVLSSPPPPSRRPRTPPPSQPETPPPSPMVSPPPPRSRRPRTPPPSQQIPLPPSSPSLPPPPSSSPPSPLPSPQSPRKIIVGGSKQWQLGFDYNDWALKNGPFYVNDILVFKYDPPNTSTPPHSVYQLPNMRSFANCDLGKAKMVANLTQGSGDGFEFVLKDQNPYYFACGEGNGFHCKLGSMKFTLTPIVQT